MQPQEQSGFPFPAVQQGPQGPLLYVRNDTKALVQASIRQILLTRKGDRPWNPEFGCDLQQFLFEPINTSMADTIRVLVFDAVTRWEPRAKFDLADIQVLPNESGLDLVIPYDVVEYGVTIGSDTVSMSLTA